MGYISRLAAWGTCHVSVSKGSKQSLGRKWSPLAKCHSKHGVELRERPFIKNSKNKKCRKASKHYTISHYKDGISIQMVLEFVQPFNACPATTCSSIQYLLYCGSLDPKLWVEIPWGGHKTQRRGCEIISKNQTKIQLKQFEMTYFSQDC